MLTFWLMNQDIPWEQNMISTWIILVETKFIDIGGPDHVYTSQMNDAKK